MNDIEIGHLMAIGLMAKEAKSLGLNMISATLGDLFLEPDAFDKYFPDGYEERVIVDGDETLISKHIRLGDVTFSTSYYWVASE